MMCYQKILSSLNDETTNKKLNLIVRGTTHQGGICTISCCVAGVLLPDMKNDYDMDYYYYYGWR